MDLLNTLLDWLEALGDGITDMVDDINYLIESLTTFIEFSTMYVYISGAILLFILVYLFSLGTRMSRTERKINMLLDEGNVMIDYNALVPCEQCGKMIEPDAEKPFCPYCGTYSNSNKK